MNECLHFSGILCVHVMVFVKLLWGKKKNDREDVDEGLS